MKRTSPARVKLRLRQEAGFGCCVCGHPFYEYHHIRDFAAWPHHDPTEMMVLCPNHHHEATVRALSEADQRKWKQNPFNITRGLVDGPLVIDTDIIAIEVGTVLFVGTGFKLVVDGNPLLLLESDEKSRLLLTMDLYDKDDSLVASIVRNEWVVGDPLPWDFEYGFQWIRIRRKYRDISLVLDARRRPVTLSGELWRNGQNFLMTEKMLVFNGVVQDIALGRIGLVGLMLSADTKESKFAIVPDPLFGEGRIYTCQHEETRIEEGIELYRTLINSRGRGS